MHRDSASRALLSQDKQALPLPKTELIPVAVSKQAHTLGTVTGAAENAEVGAPRAYGIAILMRENAGDLVQMGQVVNGPGGEKLRESDHAERGMASAAVKVQRLQIESAQLTEIRGAQGREFVE